jgi:hypothetical protein
LVYEAVIDIQSTKLTSHVGLREAEASNSPQTLF